MKLILLSQEEACLRSATSFSEWEQAQKGNFPCTVDILVHLMWYFKSPYFVTMAREKATFSLGWFWHPEDSFAKLPGVLKTSVGYTGGIMPFPTYRRMGDHTESVRVYFDPSVISYDELLAFFWDSHSPLGCTSTQYRSAIWYHSEEQLQLVKSLNPSLYTLN